MDGLHGLLVRLLDQSLEYAGPCYFKAKLLDSLLY